MKEKVYIVLAHRIYNSAESSEHSYCVGVASTLQKAVKLGEEEVNYRGGKYYYTVETWEIDGGILKKATKKTVIGGDAKKAKLRKYLRHILDTKGNELDALAGKGNVEIRQQILEFLFEKKVPKYKATLSNLKVTIYDFIGINEDDYSTLAGGSQAFENWLKTAEIDKDV